MKSLWLVAFLIPLSFWDSFMYTVPRLICETPYWVHHRVVVMPKQYTAEHLIEIGRAFTEACGEVPLCVLYMAPRNDVVGSYVLSGDSGQFENWRHRLELSLKEGSEPISDIAQVNVVNGEAVLRMRKENKVSRFVLTERDPLIYTIDGQKFEVLEIYGDLQGRNVKREYLDGGMLSISECEDCLTYFDISVRTRGELEMSRFRKLVQRLARIDVPADLHVNLRRDTWFVPSGVFAMLYAFDENVPPLPSRAEYEASGELKALVSRRRNATRYDEYDVQRRVWVDRGWEPIKVE